MEKPLLFLLLKEYFSLLLNLLILQFILLKMKFPLNFKFKWITISHFQLIIFNVHFSIINFLFQFLFHWTHLFSNWDEKFLFLIIDFDFSNNQSIELNDHLTDSFVKFFLYLIVMSTASIKFPFLTHLLLYSFQLINIKNVCAHFHLIRVKLLLNFPSSNLLIFILKIFSNFSPIPIAFSID